MATEALQTSVTDRAACAFIRWLGMAEAPPVSLSGLTELYGRWCAQVPFDNLLVRAGLAAGRRDFRGLRPDEYLDTVMTHGVGSLCMEAAEALHGLLSTLGFTAELGIAQIGAVGEGTVANHITVVVTAEAGRCFVVDTSLLSAAPIPLEDGFTFRTPTLPYTVRRDESHWEIRTATAVGKQPKLFRLFARTTHPEVAEALLQGRQGEDFRLGNRKFFAQIGSADGSAIHTYGRGFLHRTTATEVASAPCAGAARKTALREIFGMSPEIVERLPEDW